MSQPDIVSRPSANRYYGELLIFGCGFLGLRAAKLWQEHGGSVRAVTRSITKASHLRDTGIQPIVFDLMDTDGLTRALSDLTVDGVLYCVGYDRGSAVSKESLYIDGLTNAMRAVGNRASRWVYVSSSSVYGQDDGSWVDEESPTEPTSEGGQICLNAERRLRDHWPTATILRMSGLYGPERSLVRADQLRQGHPIAGNPDAWLNLIHGDDAAAACVAALTAPSTGPLYMVSDDRPIFRREYYELLARNLGAPPPRFSGESTARHACTGLNKRCRGTRIQRELNWELKFKTIEEGLALPHQRAE